MALRDSSCSKGLHGPDRQALDASNCHSCVVSSMFTGRVGVMVLVPTDSAVAVWWVSRQIRGNWNTVVMVVGVGGVADPLLCSHFV